MPTRPTLIHYALLAALCGAVLLPYTFGTSLMGPWEPHYGQVAREMLHSGNWLDPRYQGEVFWTKPILAPLAATLSYALFGVSEFTTRLPALLCGALGIFGVFAFFRRRQSTQMAWIGALSLLLFPYFALLSRRFLTDIFFTVPLVLSLLWFFEAIEYDARRRARLAWGLLALSVLAKGLLPIFITIGALTSYLILSGRWRDWRRLAPLSGLGIFLVVAVPWHAYMTAKYGPEFLRVWFIENHFQRAAGELHKPTGMFDFLLLFLGFGGFPLLALLPFAGFAWRPLRPELTAKEAFSVRLAYFLGAYLAAAALCVFFSQTKFAHYIFACVPPLALLIGLGLDRALDAGDEERPLKALLLLLSAVLLVILARDLSAGNNWYNYLTLTSDHKIREWFGAFIEVKTAITLTLLGGLLALGLLFVLPKRLRFVGAGAFGLVSLGYLGWFLFVFDPALLEVFSAAKLSDAYLSERQPGEVWLAYNDWKERNEIWHGDIEKPFVKLTSGSELAARIKQLPKGRFFVSMTKDKLEETKAILRRITGHELRILASDRYRSYEGEFMALGEWDGAVPETTTAPAAATQGVFVDPDSIRPSIVLNQRFQGLTLLGVDLPARLSPGNPVELTLYWRVDAALGQDYQRFLHLENADGQRLGLRDDAIGGAAFPSSRWQAGQVLRDSVTLPFPAEAAPGSYRLFTGFFDPRGTRLPLLDTKAQNSDNRQLLRQWDLPRLN